MPQSLQFNLAAGPAVAHLPSPPFLVQTSQILVGAVPEGYGERMGWPHHIHYNILSTSSIHQDSMAPTQCASSVAIPSPNNYPTHSTECFNCNGLNHCVALCKKLQWPHWANCNRKNQISPGQQNRILNTPREAPWIKKQMMKEPYPK